MAASVNLTPAQRKERASKAHRVGCVVTTARLAGLTAEQIAEAQALAADAPALTPEKRNALRAIFARSI